MDHISSIIIVKKKKKKKTTNRCLQSLFILLPDCHGKVSPRRLMDSVRSSTVHQRDKNAVQPPNHQQRDPKMVHAYTITANSKVLYS